MGDPFLSDIIIKEVCVELAPDLEKSAVIRAMIQALVEAGSLKKKDAEAVHSGAMERESVGSTGIGRGIAIPHCRTSLVKEMFCVYGRCAKGLDFDSLDGEPVHSLFFIATPVDQKEQHLALMKNFASMIRKEHFCDFLGQTASAKALIELLREFEER